MHGADYENQGYDQKYQAGILVLVPVEPAVVHILGQIAHRQNFRVHPVHRLLAEIPLHLVRAHKIIAHRQGIGLVFLLNRQRRFLFLYAAYAREFHLALPHFYAHVLHVPEVHLILDGGLQAHIDIIPAVRD